VQILGQIGSAEGSAQIVYTFVTFYIRKYILNFFLISTGQTAALAQTINGSNGVQGCAFWDLE